MICSNCGRTLIPGQKVCPGCRKTVANGSQKATRIPASPNNPPAVNLSFSKNSNTQQDATKTTLFVLLGIVVLLVLLGVGAWVLSTAN
jgi:hypothetical protein